MYIYISYLHRNYETTFYFEPSQSARNLRLVVVLFGLGYRTPGGAVVN
jgi:hypothetical protein